MKELNINEIETINGGSVAGAMISDGIRGCEKGAEIGLLGADPLTVIGGALIGTEIGIVEGAVAGATES